MKILLAKNIGSLIIESKEELSSASLQLIGEVKDSGILKSTI
jgi:phosphoribosylformylglycinamidine synthase